MLQREVQKEKQSQYSSASSAPSLAREAEVKAELGPRSVLDAKQIAYLNEKFKSGQVIFVDGTRCTFIQTLEHAWTSKDVPKTFELVWKANAEGKRMPRSLKSRMGGFWDILLGTRVRRERRCARRGRARRRSRRRGPRQGARVPPDEGEAGATGCHTPAGRGAPSSQ